MEVLQKLKIELQHASGFPDDLVVQNLLVNAGDQGSNPGLEDPLEKEVATHSNILVWKIPWTEEPGRLQRLGSQRVRHDLTTKQQQQPYDPTIPPLG